MIFLLLAFLKHFAQRFVLYRKNYAKIVNFYENFQNKGLRKAYLNDDLCQLDSTLR